MDKAIANALTEEDSGKARLYDAVRAGTLIAMFLFSKDSFVKVSYCIFHPEYLVMLRIGLGNDWTSYSVGLSLSDLSLLIYQLGYRLWSGSDPIVNVYRE
jgi:hypothetical protein